MGSSSGSPHRRIRQLRSNMSGTSLSSIAFSNSTEVALRKAHPNYYFDQHGSPIAAIRRAFTALGTLRVERFPDEAYASLTKLQ